MAGAHDPSDLGLVGREEPAAVLGEDARRRDHLEALGLLDAAGLVTRAHHPDLGRAVAVTDGDAGEHLGEGVLGSRAGRCAAGAQHGQCGEVVFVRAQLLEQRARRRIADDRHHVGALACGGGEDGGRVEASAVVVEHHGRAHARGEEHRPLRGDVHQRRRREPHSRAGFGPSPDRSGVGVVGCRRWRPRTGRPAARAPPWVGPWCHRCTRCRCRPETSRRGHGRSRRRRSRSRSRPRVTQHRCRRRARPALRSRDHSRRRAARAPRRAAARVRARRSLRASRACGRARRSPRPCTGS